MRTVVRVGVLAGVAVFALAGCSKPAYQFVADNQHELVLRLPVGWTKLNADDVLKSSGSTASEQTSWLTFFDASPNPSIDNVANQYADEPVMVAQTLEVTDDLKSSVTGQFLRDVIIPVNPDAEEQQAAQQLVQQMEQAKKQIAGGGAANGSASATASATPGPTGTAGPTSTPGPTRTTNPTTAPTATSAPTGSPSSAATPAPTGSTADTEYIKAQLLRSTNISTPTERGVHLVFKRTLLDHTEVYDKIAVTNPDLTRIHIVMVHCSEACFRARGAEIEQVVSSLTVKS